VDLGAYSDEVAQQLLLSASIEIFELAIVLMTAFGGDHLHQEAQLLGFVYLEKPFKPERLVEIIREQPTIPVSWRFGNGEWRRVPLSPNGMCATPPRGRP
jgi:hypothetical protein